MSQDLEKAKEHIEQNIVYDKKSAADKDMRALQLQQELERLRVDIATELESKASIADVNSQLDSKASVVDVNESLKLKANKESVIAALHRKAGKNETAELKQQLSSKAGSDMLLRLHNEMEAKCERSELWALAQGKADNALERVDVAKKAKSKGKGKAAKFEGQLRVLISY